MSMVQRPSALGPAGSTRDLQLLPALLLVAAVTFNAALAVINAHVRPLSGTAVVAVEIMLVAAAHILALANYKPQMTPWYVLLGMLGFFALVRSLYMGEIEVRYIRDVLLIPTFIVLGMTFDPRRLTMVLVAIHGLVLAVLLLEAFDTAAYSALFGIQDYYINTRGYELTSFWNEESDLFVSATRPDARFFWFVDLHRMSSIFLEPVSLGNYCILVIAFLCARFEQITPAARLFLFLGTLVALVASDGRLATMSSLIMVAGALLAPRLPRYTAVLYLPGAVLVAFALVTITEAQAGPDDFLGRLAHSVELLKRYDLGEMLGVSDAYLSLAVDSGLAYLITTQSILGVIALWLFIVFASAEDTRDQARFTQALCIYLSLSMLVSFGFLTIKTAGLFWFIHGSLQGRPRIVRRLAPGRSMIRVGGSPRRLAMPATSRPRLHSR